IVRRRYRRRLYASNEILERLRLARSKLPGSALPHSPNLARASVDSVRRGILLSPVPPIPTLSHDRPQRHLILGAEASFAPHEQLTQPVTVLAGRRHGGHCFLPSESEHTVPGSGTDSLFLVNGHSHSDQAAATTSTAG